MSSKISKQTGANSQEKINKRNNSHTANYIDIKIILQKF